MWGAVATGRVGAVAVCCLAGATGAGCEGTELTWVSAVVVPAELAWVLWPVGAFSEEVRCRAAACTDAGERAAVRCPDVLAVPADTGTFTAGTELDLVLEPPHPAAARTPVSPAAASALAERVREMPRAGARP